MKTRIFYTKFWSDSYVDKLTPKEVNAFIFLFTNDLIGLTGIYELPDSRALAALHVTQREWDAVKVKFMKDRKFAFYKGWVKIANAERYQSFTGEKNEVAKQRELSLIDARILKVLGDTLSIGYQQGMDTLHNQYTVTSKKKEGDTKGGVGRDLNFSPEDLTALKTKFSNADVEFELEKARDYLAAHPRKIYGSYPAFFRNWLRDNNRPKCGGLADGRGIG